MFAWKAWTISLVVCVSFCGVASCSRELVEFDLLTPKDADDVQRSEFGALKQVNYHVSRTYPERAVSESDLAKLRQVGWNECSRKLGDWSSYQDTSTSTHPVCKYRQMRMFKKEKMALTYIAEYDEELSGGSCPAIPNGNEQLVTVVIYKDFSTVSEAWQHEGVICSN